MRRAHRASGLTQFAERPVMKGGAGILTTLGFAMTIGYHTPYADERKESYNAYVSAQHCEYIHVRLYSVIRREDVLRNAYPIPFQSTACDRYITRD